MTIKQHGGIFGRNPSFNDLNSQLITSTGDITSSTGNFVVGTSGKGIDFSATSGTGTSELLSDYEHGTWTPTVVGATSGSATVGTVNTARYVKIGDMVNIFAYVTDVNLSTSTCSGTILISSLPFSATTQSAVASVTTCNFLNVDEKTNTIYGYVQNDDIVLTKGSSPTAVTDADFPSITNGRIMISATYQV